MFIYNVTVNVDDEIALEWLQWMREEHLPMVMATGCFKEFKFLKLLTETEQGETYAIQYYVEALETLKFYQEVHGPGLRAETEKRFGEKALAFRTVLEILD